MNKPQRALLAAIAALAGVWWFTRPEAVPAPELPPAADDLRWETEHVDENTWRRPPEHVQRWLQNIDTTPLQAAADALAKARQRTDAFSEAAYAGIRIVSGAHSRPAAIRIAEEEVAMITKNDSKTEAPKSQPAKTMQGGTAPASDAKHDVPVNKTASGQAQQHQSGGPQKQNHEPGKVPPVSDKSAHDSTKKDAKVG